MVPRDSLETIWILENTLSNQSKNLIVPGRSPNRLNNWSGTQTRQHTHHIQRRSAKVSEGQRQTARSQAMVCLADYMREVTLNFNDEDITIWAPNEMSASGVVEMMTEKKGEPGGISMISEIAHAADMIHAAPYGPIKQQLLDINEKMTRLRFGQAPNGLADDNQCVLDPEHAAALDQWRLEAEMESLHGPSFFSEWDQADGCSKFYGMKDGDIRPKEFTPEMLQQRDDLNWFFNFKWNGPKGRDRYNTSPAIVPDMIELLELTAVGDNHGVAKCVFGAVFIPKGALNHLNYNGGAEVGTIFDGEITFTPNNKFPWRLKKDGITFTYEDMTGDRHKRELEEMMTTR